MVKDSGYLLHGYHFLFRTSDGSDYLARSAKYDLLTGSCYYMEFMHQEDKGNDYYQIGVEIKDNSDPDHTMKRPEVQKI